MYSFVSVLGATTIANMARYTSGRNGSAEACYGLPLVPPASRNNVSFQGVWLCVDSCADR